MKDALYTVLFIFVVWLTVLSFLLYRDYHEDRMQQKEIREEIIDTTLPQLQKLIKSLT